MDCIRCLAESDKNNCFKIKFGVHDWNFCKKCYQDFWTWASKSCRYCLKEVKGINMSKMNKEEMICDKCCK